MKRSKFSLSHYDLTSLNPGYLVPTSCVEVLPGDTFQQKNASFIRATPLLAPPMHPYHATQETYFVPLRIIWDDFESFITGGTDGNDSTVAPYITAPGGGEAVGSLADHLGVPTGVASLVYSALPIRAYQKIWDEHYRDQDLVTAATINTGNGSDATTDKDLRNVAWEKDRLTTARPWVQKGTAVSLPIGSEAPVKTDTSAQVTGAQEPMWLKRATTGGGPSSNYGLATNSGGNNPIDSVAGAVTPQGEQYYPANLYADLTSATGATIDEWREAFGLQSFMEMRARYGSRYSEYLRSLGVRGRDSRLQRPELLSSGRATISFSEVLQVGVTTSGSTEGVGNMAGHGIATVSTRPYRRFFEEHGLVISLLHLRPIAIYADGLHKKWSRTTKEDYFTKELQLIGAEEIYNKEVRAGHTTPDGVFGYNDRYMSYKQEPSKISGDFRSASYDHWHEGRLFSADPSLNSTFVQCSPSNRMFASTSDDVFYAMTKHSIQARRLVKRSGQPWMMR